MTKRERAAAAAKWRRIARAFERNVRDLAWDNGYGTGTTEAVRCGLCWAARLAKVLVGEPVKLFREYEYQVADWYWTFDREGDDCRVIAAGLIAAMYETGEFNE